MRWIVLVLVLSAAARARADAIPPLPEECPAGTRPVSGHAGASCTPILCGASTHDPPACAAGSHCALGHAWWPEHETPVPDRARPGFPTVSLAAPGCGCPLGRCVEADMCVPDDAPPGPCPADGSDTDDDAGRSSRAGCSSCVVGGRAPSASRGLALTAMVLVLAWAKSRGTRR